MLETKDKVIELIQKLANMRIDRGCTPAEAANAAAKIEQLLEEHQLSMFDVEAKKFNEDMAIDAVELGVKAIPRHLWHLAQAVARPHDCRVIAGAGILRGWQFRFIGFRSDAAVASYLFTTLLTRLTQLADAAGRKLGRTSHGLIRYKANFISAAAAVIENRLRAEKQAVRQTATSTALVVVKDGAVKQFVEEQFPHLHTNKSRSQQTEDLDGLLDGRRAGKEVAIRSGVEDHKKRPRLEQTT